MTSPDAQPTLSHSASQSSPLSGETPAPQKQKAQGSHKRWLAGGAIALTFVLGGATGLWLRRPTGPSLIQGSGELVPQSALAAIRFDPDPAPWQQLRQVGRPSLQLGLGQWLALGGDRVANLGYGDWDEIQTQLAGAPMVALVPLAPTAHGGTSDRGSDLLLVAPLKNPKAVGRSLSQRQPPEGFENSVSTYRGVKLWDIQADLTQRHHVALLGSFLVLAADPSTVEAAIDSHFDGNALADLSDYQTAQQRFEQRSSSLLEIYLNVPAAKAAAQATGRQLPLPDGIQGMSSRFYLNGQGLALESVTWDRPRSDRIALLAPTQNNPAERAQQLAGLGDRFPASTSFFLTGSSLQQAWNHHSQVANPASLLSPEVLQQQVQAISGMDLQKDWLSWMDGPYSIGVLPIPPKANSRFQAGLTVLAQTTNRRLGERSLQKLDALMVNKYGLRLQASELDGKPVVNWSNDQGEILVTHGWLEGNVAFFVVGAPGGELLLPAPRATLAASPLYRDGMPRAEGSTPTGRLFIDVDRVLETRLPSLLPLAPASLPVLQELKSIGAERRLLDDRFTHYRATLQFLSGQGLSSPAPTEAPATEVPAAEVPATDDPAPSQATPPAAVAPEARDSRPAFPAITEPLGPPLPPATPEGDRPVTERIPPEGTTERILIERNAPSLVGPPVPDASFDFAPIGPKLPPPQQQRWSDDFIVTP